MNLYRTNIGLSVLLVGMLGAASWMRFDATRPNWEWMPDMQYSPAFSAYKAHPGLPRQQTLQPQPAGTIARGQQVFHYAATKEDAIRAGEELVRPAEQDAPQAVERGSDVYRVYCVMCHGPQGMGDGPVTRRGYPPPPPLPTGKSLQMKDGQLFHILTYGQGSMAPYASQISVEDRWNVIAYVRDMQAKARSTVPSPPELPHETSPPNP